VLDYMTGYVVFGALFLVGAIGYWVAVRAFADPAKIYLSPAETAKGAPSGSKS
jgi:hypothetical protein